MDSRKKILTAARAVEIAADLHRRGIAFTVVSGYFDVLRDAPLAKIAALAKKGEKLLALVGDPPAPVMPLNARIELAAAVRVIDYVVRAEGDPAAFAALLKPAAFIREESMHQESTDSLVMRVTERRQLH